jgi:hypothetical protein
MVELMEHQQTAVDLMHNGCVLYSGVGAGKTIASLAYYVKAESPKDIYVITTAKKRDSLDWMSEAANFGIGTTADATLHGVLHVDSWNNIGKYIGIEDAFFIFDEQRLVGNGAWVSAFKKIARRNRWIMLTATPGDSWIDYAPLFVANGWYTSTADFKRKHVLYTPYVRFPKILRYLDEDRLEALRALVLVEMPYAKHTHRQLNFVPVGYDPALWDVAVRDRWNPFTDLPIQDASELFRVMRRICNSDPSRIANVRELLDRHPRLIVWYNFNYELEILRGLNDGGVAYAEWNGHKKQPIPDTERWVYVVQYVSGAEGWNCTSTDAMCLYSLTYSYKNYEQAQGRIDRLDSAFIWLYYYVLVSSAPIDKQIMNALKHKKSFNERRSSLFVPFSANN